MWINLFIAWLGLIVKSHIAWSGRRHSLEAQQARLNHCKALFLRLRCGSTCCLNTNLIHSFSNSWWCMGMLPSLRDNKISVGLFWVENQSRKSHCTWSLPISSLQSRKTHFTWSLPISSLLCPHKFYLEIHNSHASCPLQMVSGKSNSPQISAPDLSLLH